MRVSDNQIFYSAVQDTNNALDRLYKLNRQNSSQKRIQNPSDDPAGAALAIELRAHRSTMKQFQENIAAAKGWLSQSSAAFTSIGTQVRRAMTLAEQGASGTLTATQRKSIAKQVRQVLAESIRLGNTRFAGKAVFAGHRLDGNAFQSTLDATVKDATLKRSDIEKITGSLPSSTMVEFTSSGAVGGGALNYRYTTDGGATWKTGTMAAGSNTLTVEGAQVTLRNTAAITAKAGNTPGTRIVLRPSAKYVGDTSDGVDITHMGNSPVSTAVEGNFTDNTLVRVDSAGTLSTATKYSYSTDGGKTWTDGGTTTNGAFTVPGGILRLSANGGTAINAGDQFVIRPNRADVHFDISPDTQVKVNHVGKDLFGGVVDDKVVGGPNMFDTLGKLIGALETNDSQTVANCLAELKNVEKHVNHFSARNGARINRVTDANTALEAFALNDTKQISAVEDVNAAWVSTELKKQELIYQTVVSTSRSIIQLTFAGTNS